MSLLDDEVKRKVEVILNPLVKEILNVYPEAFGPRPPAAPSPVISRTAEQERQSIVAYLRHWGRKRKESPDERVRMLGTDALALADAIEQKEHLK